MKKYPKYKPSDVEWIGDVPDHWAIGTVGRYTTLGRGRVISANEIAALPGEFPVYSSQTENSGIMGTIGTFDFEGKYVTWTTDGANAGTVFYREGKFNCTNVCGTMQPLDDTKIDLKYIPYFLNLGTKFAVRLDINPKLMNGMMAKIPLVLPPLSEQTAIVAYLDEKTSKIDTLIQSKQKLIELLKEERAAIINQAVTKGIDPNVKMKASGIEWLGEIPSHWEVKKLRYISSCQNGISQPSEYFGSGFPFISYGDVYKNEILPNTPSGLAQSSAKDQELYSIKTGDILFTRTSETVEEIAIASTAMQDIDQVVFSGFLIRVRPAAKMLNELFSSFYFRSSLHRDFFTSGMNIVTRASLSQELLKNLPVLLPPLHEQEAIGKHLLERSAAVTTSIETLTRQIDLLQEYRTALISEVVTGKFRVIN